MKRLTLSLFMLLTACQAGAPTASRVALTPEPTAPADSFRVDDVVVSRRSSELRAYQTRFVVRNPAGQARGGQAVVAFAERRVGMLTCFAPCVPEEKALVSTVVPIPTVPANGSVQLEAEATTKDPVSLVPDFSTVHYLATVTVQWAAAR